MNKYKKSETELHHTTKQTSHTQCAVSIDFGANPETLAAIRNAAAVPAEIHRFLTPFELAVVQVCQELVAEQKIISERHSS